MPSGLDANGILQSIYDPTTNSLRVSGGSTPSGPAGGDLTGTYPNPTVGSGTITDAKVAAGAAIAPTKIALVNDGSFTTPGQRTASYLLGRRRKAARWYMPSGTRMVTGQPAVAVNAAVAAAVGWFVPFLAERPITIDALGLDWVTAPTAGQIRFGLYADDGEGLVDGAALQDSGLVTASTVNGTNQQVTGLSWAISTPGLYHLCFLSCNNITGSPTVKVMALAADLMPPTASGNAPGGVFASGLTTTLPVPSHGGTESQASGGWPIVYYRTSAYT